MIVRIVNSSPHALPEYQTAGAAGLDLRAWLPNGPVTLESLERFAVPTGLFLEIPEGFEVQIRPRSGLTMKKGLSVVNSPGTVDCDYRGEILIPIVNLDPNPQTIQDGDRVAQMVLSRYERVEWEAVDALANDTERGKGGFGHTGL